MAVGWVAFLVALTAGSADAQSPERYGACEPVRLCVTEATSSGSDCEEPGSHETDATGFVLTPDRGLTNLVWIDGGAGASCEHSQVSGRQTRSSGASLRVIILPLGILGLYEASWYDVEQEDDGERQAYRGIGTTGIEWRSTEGDAGQYCQMSILPACPLGPPPPPPSEHAWGSLFECSETPTDVRETDAAYCFAQNEPGYAKAEAEAYAAWGMQRADELLLP